MSKTKLDPGRTIELAASGLNNAEIARVQGVHKATVGRFLDKHQEELAAAEYFKQNHASFLTALQSSAASLRFDILAELRKRGVEGMTAHELKSLYHSLSVCQGVDFDKERLLTGQSTANVYHLFDQANEQANRALGIN
ncbi:hypothetical protein [Pseudodesulfovibrio indicus]|uniref:Resolvase HTH domain-containing protein n=1 Tax=Pseudodesulfovibrio indicus TaxID=1716143 RepID=A0A126QSR7_9BACT|nr:hypothetical protein [Pseudodesulfovibrio indicus]AMK12475.1 hypothetical protein AWY79_15885 [Pseudodesulfovibrio indicus]TDT90780.1 hypothetical protein EDC59_102210 [Pseudodesulfovibrio indicus]